MKEYKLDIFEVLRQIDKGNYQFFDNLSEEEQKAFVPLITMRWMSGTSSDAQILILNQYVNPYVFSLFNHKALLFKLLNVASTGRSQRYKWLGQKKAAPKQPIALNLLREYYKCSSRVANEYIKLLKQEDAILMAESLGYQKDEITKLKAEFKKAA